MSSNSDDILREAEAIIQQAAPPPHEPSNWPMHFALGLIALTVLWHTPTMLRDLQESIQGSRLSTTSEETPPSPSPLPPWERIEQVPEEDVTAFATDFLRRLGYPLHGELVLQGWTPAPALGGAYKHYVYYALIDPAWPPLRLQCGPQSYDALLPLSCYIFPLGE